MVFIVAKNYSLAVKVMVETPRRTNKVTGRWLVHQGLGNPDLALPFARSNTIKSSCHFTVFLALCQTFALPALL
jgi:hypothetical protein